MRSPAHCTPCNAFVGAGFYPARSSAPLVTDAGRCGHRPLRSSIGEWRCRGRPPGRPAQPCTALLAKTLSLRTSDRFTAVAIRSPRPWYRGITDSHDQSADWSRNDTQILSTSVTAVAIRPPSPKMLFPSRKKGPRHPAEPLFKPIQFIRNPHCPPCVGAALHPGCCSLP